MNAEAAIAKHVIEHLEAELWDVYQEVQIGPLGGIADIVAVRDGVSHIIEVKTSFSLALLQQAMDWRGYANYISVACETSDKRTECLKEEICRWSGIGYYRIFRGEFWNIVPPRLWRKVRCNIKDAVRPEHKVWAPAGNNKGQRYTEFARTCRNLLEIVRANPNCTFKQAMAGMKHHYASDATASTALRHWLKRGIVHGLALDHSTRPARIVLTQ